MNGWTRLREKAGEEDAHRRRLRRAAVQRPTEEVSGFEDALDDDLNISGALGVLFETIRETNRALDLGKLEAEAASSWLRWWERIDRVLAMSGEENAMPAEIAALGRGAHAGQTCKGLEKK